MEKAQRKIYFVRVKILRKSPLTSQLVGQFVKIKKALVKIIIWSFVMEKVQTQGL